MEEGLRCLADKWLHFFATDVKFVFNFVPNVYGMFFFFAADRFSKKANNRFPIYGFSRGFFGT